jgi:hypothetical protein
VSTGNVRGKIKMGYIAHDAVLVTASGYILDDGSGIAMPDVEAFRQSLPEEWRRLVVGPVGSVMGGYLHFAFLPDGSKEGWPDSDLGDEYRKRFAELFSAGYEDGSSPFDVVMVRYGDDDYDVAHATPVLPEEVRP